MAEEAYLYGVIPRYKNWAESYALERYDDRWDLRGSDGQLVVRPHYVGGSFDDLKTQSDKGLMCGVTQNDEPYSLATVFDRSEGPLLLMHEWGYRWWHPSHDYADSEGVFPAKRAGLADLLNQPRLEHLVSP